MHYRVFYRVCFAVLLTLVCAAPRAARAKEDAGAKACLADHVRGQELRASGRLLESREAFVRCAQNACPTRAVTDCAEWFEQVQQQIPSLTFRVTADGESRADVRVLIDGKLVLDGLTGKSVEVDPGTHRLRIELEPYPPFERELLLSEGDRFRLIEVAFAKSKPKPKSLTREQPPPRVEEEPEQSPVRMQRPTPAITYVLGTVGIVAAASGTAFGLSSWTLKTKLEGECSPRCTEQQIDNLKRRALLADLSWGVSIVSLATAMGVYLLRPEQPDTATRIDVAMLRGGGTLRLRMALP